MTIDELLAEIEMKGASISEDDIVAFESEIGHRLPSDYRNFLADCNGGWLREDYWNHEQEAGVNHIGGLRDDGIFSLRGARECYGNRIPNELIWIMDDPFGNAICLCVTGDTSGGIYFWDHEDEPDPEEWDGSLGKAENVRLLTNSFIEFVSGLAKDETNPETIPSSFKDGSYMSDIGLRLRTIMSEDSGIAEEEIIPKYHIKNDLKLDDIGFKLLVMSIESGFFIKISDEVAKKFTTVRDVINYLEAEAK